MGFGTFLRGRVGIKVNGLGTERFFNICKNNGIKVYNLRFEENEAHAAMSIEDFRKIRPFRRASGVHIALEKRFGMPFWLYSNRNRQFFVCGIMLFFGINFFMSRYLWRIEVEGNSYYSAKSIVDFVESLDVSYGTKTSDISCYYIETALRREFDKITWVSADIDGSRLLINIKENEDAPSEYTEGEPCDIVAAKDGVVSSIITRSGTPIVKAGDTVKAGDVLVMSKVDSQNESGESFGVRYTAADADVILETEYYYNDYIARAYEKKTYTGREKERQGIKIGDRMINYNVGKCDYDNYDIFVSYEAVRPYKNLTLPITYAFLTYKEYEIIPSEYTDEELDSLINGKIDKYIENLQENSVQIISNSVKIEIDGEGASAEGAISVREPAALKEPPVINESEGTAE
ncbi:MAG: sporulation protein YqfD [Butyrivibrio sp.]|nr:sporulation protein YqfD [Butyrivibrio sp.]